MNPFLRDILTLAKPRITIMALVVALGCMALAPVSLAFVDMLLAMVGIGLLVSGSGAFNMYFERELDGLMERTKNRPLPTARLNPGWALGVAVTLSILAIALLIFATNWLTVFLGIGALVAYVWIYTPMKRHSAWALVVGAFPGAMPALLGYTAASSEVDGKSLALFGIAFFWQLPHFIAISIYRKDEYARAGFPVVPNVWGIEVSKILILLTTAMLLLSSFSLWFFHVGGELYAVTSLGFGFWFLYLCYMGFHQEDTFFWAKKIFRASLIYQTALFVSLVLDIGVRNLLGD